MDALNLSASFAFYSAVTAMERAAQQHTYSQASPLRQKPRSIHSEFARDYFDRTADPKQVRLLFLPHFLRERPPDIWVVCRQGMSEELLE